MDGRRWIAVSAKDVEKRRVVRGGNSGGRRRRIGARERKPHLIENDVTRDNDLTTSEVKTAIATFV